MTYYPFESVTYRCVDLPILALSQGSSAIQLDTFSGMRYTMLDTHFDGHAECHNGLKRRPARAGLESQSLYISLWKKKIASD